MSLPEVRGLYVLFQSPEQEGESRYADGEGLVPRVTHGGVVPPPLGHQMAPQVEDVVGGAHEARPQNALRNKNTGLTYMLPLSHSNRHLIIGHSYAIRCGFHFWNMLFSAM